MVAARFTMKKSTPNTLPKLHAAPVADAPKGAASRRRREGGRPACKSTRSPSTARAPCQDAVRSPRRAA